MQRMFSCWNNANPLHVSRGKVTEVDLRKYTILKRIFDINSLLTYVRPN